MKEGRGAFAAADRIARSNARGLNAVLAYDRANLLAQAEARMASGGNGSLEGVAIAIKDNICTLEYPTTCASRILEGYRSPYEATVFGRTVDHAARVLAVVSGRDCNDSTSADLNPLPFPNPRPTLAGLIVGTPQEFFPRDLDPATRAACDRALGHLRDAGATIRPVSLPHTRLAVPTYYVVAPAEASSNLARFDGVRYGVRESTAGDDLGALYRKTRGRGFGPE